MRLGVNGRFYAAPITGVQRFAREVTARLCESESVVMLLPRDATAPPRVVQRSWVVRGRLTGPAWEQLELPHRVRRERCALLLNLANAAPTRGTPQVMMLHDVTPLTNPEWFTRRFVVWFRLCVKRAARRATRVLVPSAWAKEETARVIGVGEDRLTVVTQGIEPFDTPAEPEAVARVRNALGLTGRYVLTVGGTNPRKNAAWLLDVLARWPKDAGPVPTLVVAGTASPGVHRAAALERGVAMRELSYVPDDDLRALYTGAEAFCFPSLSEGFGRPPLEAMGCGAPVIAAPYGAAQEVLGGAAQVLPLEVEAWARALARLTTDKEHRARWITQGAAHATWFRWDTAATQVAQVCREVAQ